MQLYSLCASLLSITKLDIKKEKGNPAQVIFKVADVQNSHSKAGNCLYNNSSTPLNFIASPVASQCY